MNVDMAEQQPPHRVVLTDDREDIAGVPSARPSKEI
jgi:hypothetical protein